MKKILVSVLAVCLAALMLYSGYRAWQAYGDYRAEADMHGAVMEFKPQEDESINQSVIDLRAMYPDVVGWLTVPGTNVDYPFVQAGDNDHYLRRDLNGDYALAGTLFMDYRCEQDFLSQNSIIYGHHMKNGSMFGTLVQFNDAAFFEENRVGTIFLPFETWNLEFFAFMVINPATETEIYNTVPQDGYWDYVNQNARYYRDIALTDSDRIVTLSTCAYEFENARMVLLARLGKAR